MNTTQKTTTAQIIAGTPLAGRVAVVTGASSGIGAAAASAGQTTRASNETIHITRT